MLLVLPLVSCGASGYCINVMSKDVQCRRLLWMLSVEDIVCLIVDVRRVLDQSVIVEMKYVALSFHEAFTFHVTGYKETEVTQIYLVIPLDQIV